ncbi:MAG: transketolase [Chitinivibrionales bacterium]
MSMEQSRQISRKAIALCRMILDMTTEAGSGHASSALSLVHIVTVLMYRIMRHDPVDPWHMANDRLVLSEGHAVPVVYAACADLCMAYGKSPLSARRLSPKDITTLREIDSVLDGHPNPSLGFPFFDVATGSLGQGLSAGAGLALAARLDNIQKNVFVLIGDGESREGQVWEACDFIMDYDLAEVVPIFNCNGEGQSDLVSRQQSADTLQKKVEAYGFVSLRIDGHDPDQIVSALTTATEADRPHAIIAETVKGWGVDEFRRANYHGKPLKKQMLEAAHADLSRLEKRLDLDSNDIPSPVPPLPDKRGIAVSEPGRLGNPDFGKLLRGDAYAGKYEKGLMSTRRAYGLALRELAARDSRVVGLDGDVKNSTYSSYLYKAQKERMFEGRIAEQNLISAAAGLAAGGKIPFVSSFAKFLVRGYDQLELALISDANIKLVGSHAGANIGADGPSQMGLTDLAYMSCLATVRNREGNPLLVVFNPCCGVQAYKCVQLMADFDGAAYMRTMRPDLPVLYEAEDDFETGGAKVLREGRDVTLVASGYMVHSCLQALEYFDAAGIDPTIIDAYSLPLKQQTIIQAAQMGNGMIVTLEDNYGNGLGAAVAGIIAQTPDLIAQVNQIYVRKLPKSGRSGSDVLDDLSLGINDIVEQVSLLVKQET